MAVSSVKHNKPVLPRTSDGSDLGSNRASIYSGKALSFDGVNDTIAINNPEIFYSFAGEITIAVWAKWTYSSDNEELFRVENGSDRILFSFQTGQILSFGTKDNNGSYVELDISITNYLAAIDGKWAYYVATHDSQGNRKIYINGELIGSDSRGEGVYATGNAIPYIGSSAGTGEFFTGQMSDFKFFDVALTQAQIQELQINPEQKVPTGIDPLNLKAHYPMTEGAGSYVYNANANAIGTELISNAGFDETCQKWGTTDDNTVEIAGGKAIWTNAPLSGSFVEQPLDLEAGKFYRVSFDYTSTMFNIFVNLGDTQEAVPLGNGRYTYDMYYGTGNKSIKFQHGWTTSSSASVDNVSVKEVVPNYYNGTINGATWVSGLPEPLPQTALMDWNKGTNHVVYSNEFTSTGWSSNFSSNNKVSRFINPFGNPGAWKISIPSGSSYYVYRTLSGFASGSVTMSGWFRADQETVVGFNDGNNYPNSITIGTEWERKSFTFTYGGGGIGIQMDNYFGVSPSSLAKEFYVYGLQATQGSETQPYIETQATAQTSPVLIKEGSTAGKDVFGNTITNPRASGAYNFDGDSWAEVQDNASLDFGSNAFTIESWLNLNSLGTYQVILEKGQAGIGTTRGFMFRIRNNNLVQITVTGDSEVQISNTTISANEWNHLCVTKDSSYFKLYINGLYIAQASSPAGSIDTSDSLYIGKDKTNGWSVIGQVSNPRVYNYALTAQQVADNFNEKASTFGGTKVASELDAYIERTASDGATVEAHSCLVNYLTELDKK